MVTYYFDLKVAHEEGGKPDMDTDRIVTISYRPFYDNSGRPKDDLVILKSWESSEEEILKEFIEFTGWNEDEPDPWRFVPSNFGLAQSLTILSNRCKALLNIELDYKFLLNLPKIDLKAFGIIKRKGNFKKTSLPNFSKKLNRAYTIGILIEEENWEELEGFIRQEASVFLKIYKKLIQKVDSIFP